MDESQIFDFESSSFRFYQYSGEVGQIGGFQVLNK